MPTYDYRCDSCNHQFEEFQSFSEKVLKKCPKCRKSKLRRLLGTGAAIIFKGAGFYQTDYRSESYKTAAKAEDTSAPSPKDAAADKAKAPPASDNSGSSGTTESKGTGKKAKSSS